MSDINGQFFSSPFLNFDPSILTNTQNNFLHLDGSDERSRFERSCCEIGGVALTGGILGSVYGMIRGLSDPNIKTLPNRSVQRTQILNHITKTSGGIGQKCGMIGLIYAACDALIHKIRQKDDVITTISATTATGLLLNSHALLTPPGWKRVTRGGAIGLFIGSAIAVFSEFDKITFFITRNIKDRAKIM